MQNEITELRYQVRTLKRIVYGFGCLLVAGIVVGATSLQTVPDVIQAKKFEVVNNEGDIVIEMTQRLLNGSFYGVVKTQNSYGQPLVILGATRNGEGIVITKNSKGQTLTQLFSTTGVREGQAEEVVDKNTHFLGMSAQALDEVLSMSTIDSDPIKWREKEIEKGSLVNQYIIHINNFAATIESGSETWTKDRILLKELLEVFEQHGVIKDTSNLKDALARLQKISNGLGGMQGHIETLRKEILHIKDPRTQYEEAMRSTMNDDYNGRFKTYDQLMAQVKDMLNNPDNYSDGYSLNFFGTYNMAHDIFKDMLRKTSD